jgi:glycerol-3-phosphate acyltransferase PlsY
MLNIEKVGSGHPDTENIYQNVSKPLGVLVGAVDLGKIYLYLLILDFVFSRVQPQVVAEVNLMMVYGFAMIVGHCMPVTNRFKGGRGIFTFIGFAAYFVFYPMLIIVIFAAIVIAFFKQIRFAQYMIVLLPPFVSYFFPSLRAFIPRLLLISVLMGIMNYFVSKRLGEM